MHQPRTLAFSLSSGVRTLPGLIACVLQHPNSHVTRQSKRHISFSSSTGAFTVSIDRNPPVDDADTAVELATDAVVLHHFVHPVESLLGQLVLGAQQFQHFLLELPAHSNEFCRYISHNAIEKGEIVRTIASNRMLLNSILHLSLYLSLPSRSWAIVG